MSHRRISWNFYVVCTRPIENNGLGLPPAVVGKVLTRLESLIIRIPDSDEAYAEWRRLVILHGVSGKTAHDARLVAAMNVHGITHILTFNVEDFTRYDGIRTMHPAQVTTPGF